MKKFENLRVYLRTIISFFTPENLKRTTEYSKKQHEETLKNFKERDKTFYVELMNHIKRFKPDSVLEIGCGNGRNLAFLQKAIDCKLYGLELTETGCAITKKSCPDIDIYCGSAERLPYKDNSIDVIYTVHALEQMPYIIGDVIKEIKRVCRKGIVLYEPFFERQNVFGKMHNISFDYVKNIERHIRDNGFFDIEHFDTNEECNPVNKPAYLIAKVKLV